MKTIIKDGNFVAEMEHWAPPTRFTRWRDWTTDTRSTPGSYTKTTLIPSTVHSILSVLMIWLTARVLVISQCAYIPAFFISPGNIVLSKCVMYWIFTFFGVPSSACLRLTNILNLNPFMRWNYLDLCLHIYKSIYYCMWIVII